MKLKPVKIQARDYQAFIEELKSKVKSARINAAFSVNRQLICLYWEIGKTISEKQKTAGWGDSVVDQIAADMKKEFPEVRGFSRSNFFAMRQFYLAYNHSDQFVQQLVGQIPWGHNLLLLSKVKDQTEREWYIRQTIENGWSRAILEHQIETGLIERQSKKGKTNNFATALPQAQSELVQQTVKDPYVFDFFTLGKKAKERDLQNTLVEKIKNFMLELGSGFAFMGNEYHLRVDGNDYYIDLLFFHHRLRCLFAIELKMDDFKPEYAGKMNFYLTALDEMVKHESDNPSVGLILCKGKNKTVVEYSLRDTKKPIGVSCYKLTRELNKEYRKNLPSTVKLTRLINTK